MSSVSLWLRYEGTQLHESIYQLHVKLLAADKSTVISEHSVSPTEDCGAYSHNWKEVRDPVHRLGTVYGHLFESSSLTACPCVGLQVSHVFSGYGPGVRYVSFLNRVKNNFLNGFWQTRCTGSSVMVRPVKTSSWVLDWIQAPLLPRSNQSKPKQTNQPEVKTNRAVGLIQMHLLSFTFSFVHWVLRVSNLHLF